MTARGRMVVNVTVIGLAVLMAAALVGGLVVATWPGPVPDRLAVPQPQPSARGSLAIPVASAPSTVEVCNRYAAARTRGAGEGLAVGEAVEVVRDAAAPVAGGALFGIDESRRQDARYRASFAECMRARLPTV